MQKSTTESGETPRRGDGGWARGARGARFDVRRALARAEAAVADVPKAALFALYERGFTSPFEQLCACIISIRTFDEVTIPTALALFAKGRTPADIARLSVAAIDAALRSSTFHTAKAAQIKEIARRCVDEFGGQVPCDREVLLSFRGVGPKCAHLVLGIACGEPHIGVDVHVHRVTNRWGYVEAPTPERTMAALMKTLPQDLWLAINRVLVPFGKHVCTGKRPRCSACPLVAMCAQVGVTESR